MKKSSKPKKGVRYVATALKKYLPGQFTTYQSALLKAREITESLKKSGTTVKLDTILPLARVASKSKKKQIPHVDPKMLQQSYYFDLIEYPTYILKTDAEVYFKSKLFPAGVEQIQGGDAVDYGEYFAPYVSYINGVKSLTDPEERRYETDWLVQTTEPVWNRGLKRWESEIISLNGDGEKFDYGFDRKKPEQKAKDVVSGTKTVPSDTTTPKKEETSADLAKTDDVLKIEAETKRLEAQEKVNLSIEKVNQQTNITNALKLYGEGLLTKQEFKDLMSQIKR